MGSISQYMGRRGVMLLGVQFVREGRHGASSPSLTDDTAETSGLYPQENLSSAEGYVVIVLQRSVLQQTVPYPRGRPASPLYRFLRNLRS